MISVFNFFEREIENPDTILIRNPLCVNGLTEKDVYDYYQSHKRLILDQVEGREVILFLAVQKNKFVVKRNIKLTKSNFDKIIHPRVVSIHSTMNKKENFGIIDIDCNHFGRAKKITHELYYYLRNTFPKLSIRFTGKESFHIHCPFVDNNKRDIDKIRLTLKDLITNFNTNIPHTKFKTKTNTIPNIDLAPNKYRGGYITLHSLSVLGLRCMEVNIENLLTFQRQEARIGVK